MKKKFFLLVILLYVSGVKSYAQFNYFPFYSADSTECIRLSEECSKKISSSFLLPPKVSSEYKKQFNKQKEETSDYVKSLVKYTSMNDGLINPFLQSVFSKVAAGNPELKDYTVVLSNWPVMNAAYVGGHTIIFYVPLLSRLQNEDQVAAVLCHELAHGELDHVQKSIRKNLDQLYNKEFQKELKRTLKEEFNVREKINMLALKFAFQSTYHSRELEKAADSLGYFFLLKSGYDAHQSVSLLELLKHIDEPAFTDTINYGEFFNCPSSSFDFSKLQRYKPGSIFNRSAADSAKEEALRDSLRTHPDCDKRIGYIRDLMISNTPNAVKQNDSTHFRNVKWASAMETIMAYYDYTYYDYSLFNALLYLHHAKENEFLKFMVALNWYSLYEATKNHELSDYVSNYSVANPAEHNNLLFVLNNLRFSELTEFMNCYYRQNASSFKQDEFNIAISYCMSKLKGDGKESTWQDKYKAAYEDGRFSALMEPKVKPGKKKKK